MPLKIKWWKPGFIPILTVCELYGQKNFKLRFAYFGCSSDVSGAVFGFNDPISRFFDLSRAAKRRIYFSFFDNTNNLAGAVVRVRFL